MRALKSLPDDRFIVWQRLAIWEDPGPDFLVLKDGSRAVLVKVSSATPRQARLAVQPELLSTGASSKPIGQAEREVLAQFLHSLANPGRGVEPTSIPALVFFPNVPRQDFQASAAAQSPNGVLWVPMNDLRPEGIQARIEQHLSRPLEPACLEALRAAFTPEAVVPAALTVRAPIERDTAAGLTDFLLDYDQEWVLKCDLDLNDEARRAAKDLGVRLINGVAGSGKSLIIVYRALLLRRFFPDKSILVLTHNRPLIRDLQAKYEMLSAGDTGVEWRTFLSWCLSQWPNREEVQPIGKDRRRELIAEVWAQHFADTAVTQGILETELDWFKDRTISKRSEYLVADRTGRGFALQESMRNRFFDAFAAYQKKLEALGQLDWGDVPRKIWGATQDGVIAPPRYDVVLVDEAQFFAPIWFEIIKTLLDPAAGHLFLVADPTQGFLGRGQSWIASGLEVRGRSHRLNKSYRTTRRILDFATWMYRMRIPDEQEDIVVPNLDEMPEGVVPMLIPLTSPQDEITRVVNEIVRLVAEGVPREHIPVIHSDWKKGVERLLARLNDALGSGSAVYPKEGNGGQAIRVCTLNATAGLESPIVFLVGLNTLYEQEHSLRVSDEERVELIRDNTRKVYMAITRAGQRIVITYAGELPEWLQPPR